jgi:hypothetical protein
MIDKLIVLCPKITECFRALALAKGRPGYGYERFVDLRGTEYKLPVRLYYQGQRTLIHKADIIDVADLGLKRVKEILEAIFPSLHRIRIFRIDACWDILGRPVWDFVLNSHIPMVQNFRLFRSRGAVSLYLRSSDERTLLVYDRGRYLKSKADPLANVFKPDDDVTRIEVQLRGKVPFKRFVSIARYKDCDWLGNLEFLNLKLRIRRPTPTQILAGHGLRQLISKYGVQATSQLYEGPEWAAIRKRHFEPPEANEVARLKFLFKKGVCDWLENRVRFPRARK